MIFFCIIFFSSIFSIFSVNVSPNWRKKRAKIGNETKNKYTQN